MDKSSRICMIIILALLLLHLLYFDLPAWKMVYRSSMWTPLVVKDTSRFYTTLQFIPPVIRNSIGVKILQFIPYVIRNSIGVMIQQFIPHVIRNSIGVTIAILPCMVMSCKERTPKLSSRNSRADRINHRSCIERVEWIGAFKCHRPTRDSDSAQRTCGHLPHLGTSLRRTVCEQQMKVLVNIVINGNLQYR